MNKETTNIYQKLQLIQSNIGQLAKTEENKFQKYKYVSEYEILKVLRPLLTAQNLTLTFSDEINNPFSFHSEKIEKEWTVKYLKKMMIINTENPNWTTNF